MPQTATRHASIIADLVSQLYNTEELSARFDCYQYAVCTMGFDAVCYSFEPKSSFNPELKRPPIFQVSADFPQNFLHDYRKKGWYQHDFTIREICEGNLSPKDWKHKERHGNLSPEEKKLIQRARTHYGINNAISIPTMNHSTGLAGASILSFQDDPTFRQLKQHYLQTLVYCTRVFNDIIMQHPSQLVQTFVYEKLPHVTPKQRLVLRELLKGTPIKNIGSAINISTSAVENHLANLRKAFAVHNTAALKHRLETLNMMDYL